MNIATWALLAFASWTLALLLATVGVYRWSRILTGRVPIRDFRADQVEGADWYKRAMRAHANCVENLPVFACIVFALTSADIGGARVDYLCVTVVVARIAQSLTHVCFVQSNLITSLRFGLFFTQILSFFWLIAIIVSQANVTA